MASAGEWVREHCVRFVLAKAGMQLMGRNRISLGMHCLRAWVVTAQGKQSGRFAAVQILCLLLCLPVVEQSECSAPKLRELLVITGR